jgi:hypothetical protein
MFGRTVTPLALFIDPTNKGRFFALLPVDNTTWPCLKLEDSGNKVGLGNRGGDHRAKRNVSPRCSSGLVNARIVLVATRA